MEARSSGGLVTDVGWALRLSRRRRAAARTPARRDAAFLDVPVALGQLLLARRTRRVVTLTGPDAVVVLRGGTPTEGVPLSIGQFVCRMALGVVVFWLAPVLVVPGLVLTAPSWARRTGLDPEWVTLLLVSVAGLWLSSVAARLIVWGVRTHVRDAERLAHEIAWLAPTVHVAAAWRGHDEAAWLTEVLPRHARRLRVPVTLDPARLGIPAAVTAASRDWRPVDGASAAAPTLFVTNPTRRRATAQEAREQRRVRGNAAAVRVGLAVVGAFVCVAAPLTGYLAWRADVGFDAPLSARSQLGSVWDYTYSATSTMLGFGDAPPISLLGHVVALFVQAASLVLTAGIIAAFFNALVERSARLADQQAERDLLSLQRAGLLQSTRPERRWSSRLPVLGRRQR